MKFLRKVFFGLVYALPAVLYFSYHPVISLGSDDTMNFELSLPLIWLVIFCIVALITFLHLCIKRKYFPVQVIKRASTRAAKSSSPVRTGAGADHLNRKIFTFIIMGCFPLYATLSCFWSVNPIRAILTAGIIWLIFCAAFALLYILPLLHPAKCFARRLITVFFVSSAAVCLFCWLQCLLDTFGTSRAVTLLCPGCTSWTFGFPHPSGFAIEPQFMGNLLLAPTLLALYLLVFRPQPLSRWQYLILLALTSLFSTTLFLTLSRGAIYAYAVAVVILLIFAFYRRHQLKVSPQNISPESQVTSKTAPKWAYLIIIPVLTFAYTLIYQGIFSAVGPTTDNFTSGITKVIHQLSLGIIDLRGLATTGKDKHPDSSIDQSASVEKPVENSQATTDKPTLNPVENTDTSENSAHFDGYIAASTNVRLGLNEVALATWRYDPAGKFLLSWSPPFGCGKPCTVSYNLSPLRMLFGVGLGGAGVAMSRAFPEHELIAPNAIVQNEPISLLLELGLVGIALVILALWFAFRPRSEFWRRPALPLFCALIAAYVVTLQFFSGPANALQIYLMPPLLYITLALASKSACPQKSAKTSQKH